jgi:hypothetical protein
MEQAPPPSIRVRVWSFARRLVPWVSLVMGLASAITMNRRPERAWMVAAAAGAGWLVLGLFALLDGRERKQWITRAAHRSTVFATQSLIQLCLFFALPFFAQAAAVPAHWGFVGVLILASAITLWNPLYEAVLKQPVSGAALQAVATFAGLDCVLPVLGLSNLLSLLVATLATAAGLPLQAMATASEPERRTRRAIVALFVSGAVVAAFMMGGARFVPPAPLKFVAGGIGTRIVERQLVDPTSAFAAPPPEITCATAIAAPRGLRDRLHHVWRQDGARRADLQLEIRGGRERGFRTWSVRRSPGPGRWTCSVETESGQLLGRVSVHIGGSK